MERLNFDCPGTLARFTTVLLQKLCLIHAHNSSFLINCYAVGGSRLCFFKLLMCYLLVIRHSFCYRLDLVKRVLEEVIHVVRILILFLRGGGLFPVLLRVL